MRVWMLGIMNSTCWCSMHWMPWEMQCWYEKCFYKPNQSHLTTVPTRQGNSPLHCWLFLLHPSHVPRCGPPLSSSSPEEFISALRALKKEGKIKFASCLDVTVDFHKISWIKGSDFRSCMLQAQSSAGNCPPWWHPANKPKTSPTACKCTASLRQ